MYDDGDFLVTKYNGEPDHWNTKPPLTVWSQVFWMKIIGPGEMAVRLPSAIAGLLTCFLLVFFCRKALDDPLMGAIAALILVSSYGFVNLHVTRSGDYDAMLTLFTTLTCFAAFLFLDSKHKRWTYVFWIGLTLAVLTKSIAGLLFVPGIVAFLVWDKKLIAQLKNKHNYIGAGLFLVFVLAYFIARESADPGYFKAVYDNDLGGRFNKALDAHRGSFWFYFNYITSGHMAYFYLLIPLGWMLGFVSKNEKWRRLNAYTVFLSVSYFLVISLAKTKLEWYDAPLIPILAINVAMAMKFLFEFVANSGFINKSLKSNPLPFFLLFVLHIGPYSGIIDQTFAPEEKSWDKEFYEPGYWLRNNIKEELKPDYRSKRQIFRSDYAAQNRFYVRQAQLLGLDHKFVELQDVELGDNLVVLNKKDLQLLKDTFKYWVTEDFGLVKKIQIRDTLLKVPDLIGDWNFRSGP